MKDKFKSIIDKLSGGPTLSQFCLMGYVIPTIQLELHEITEIHKFSNN